MSRGIVNEWNTCFLNGAIQVIRGMPTLHAALLDFCNSPAGEERRQESERGPIPTIECTVQYTIGK